MTEVEHVEFLNSVIHKHGLNVKVPLVSDPSFPTPIIAYFKSDADGYSLLALSMVAYLIDHCRETTDFELLLPFAQEIASLVRERPSRSVLEVAAQELRTALFCEFIRGRDRRMIEAESALLSSLTGGSRGAIRRADASLSQGVGQMLQVAKSIA